MTPQLRFFWISLGSTPSSQTFVPVAVSDVNDTMNSLQAVSVEQVKSRHAGLVVRQSP